MSSKSRATSTGQEGKGHLTLCLFTSSLPIGQTWEGPWSQGKQREAWKGNSSGARPYPLQASRPKAALSWGSENLKSNQLEVLITSLDWKIS